MVWWRMGSLLGRLSGLLFICLERPFHICDMTHWYMWHDCSTCVIRLILMFDVTHSYIWRDLFICVTWFLHMSDMPHSYVWHDQFIYGTWLIHGRPSNMNASRCTYECDMLHIWNIMYCTYQYDVGWLRSVGSIKSHVSFAEYRLFYRALLQKRPIILSILPTKVTPYESHMWSRSWHIRMRHLWNRSWYIKMRHMWKRLWHIRMRHMAHIARMNEISRTCAMCRGTRKTKTCRTYEWVMSQESGRTCECDMSHAWMNHVAHANESCHTYEWVTLHMWRKQVN